MNIDELKQNWNALNLPDNAAIPGTSELESKVANRRVTTLRDKMYHLHVTLCVVACFATLTMVPFAKDNPWLMVSAVAFFILMAALHLSLAIWIRNLDYSRMTVKAAIQSVYEFERRRNLYRVIGICLAVSLIGYMVYVFAGEDPALLGGCVCGAIIGILVGLMINHRSVTLLREMRRELGDA